LGFDTLIHNPRSDSINNHKWGWQGGTQDLRRSEALEGSTWKLQKHQLGTLILLAASTSEISQKMEADEGAIFNICFNVWGESDQKRMVNLEFQAFREWHQKEAENEAIGRLRIQTCGNGEHTHTHHVGPLAADFLFFLDIPKLTSCCRIRRDLQLHLLLHRDATDALCALRPLPKLVRCAP